MERFKQKLLQAGIPFRENEPLAAHCTFKIGGPAQLFVQPQTEQQLCSAAALCKEQAVRYYLLGNGSNILFADEGFAGVVIDISALGSDIAVEGNMLTAGAGVRLAALCRAALEHGLSGLEFAYGIPGTVGGAVYMNAGAYGGEMKDVLTVVRYLTAEGEVVQASAAELDLSYRHSIFEENGGCVWTSSRWISPAPAAPSSARQVLLQLHSSTSAACAVSVTAVPPSATSTAALWSTSAVPLVPMCWLSAMKCVPS